MDDSLIDAAHRVLFACVEVRNQESQNSASLANF
jgi:hypothetical protein